MMRAVQASMNQRWGRRKAELVCSKVGVRAEIEVFEVTHFLSYAIRTAMRYASMLGKPDLAER